MVMRWWAASLMLSLNLMACEPAHPMLHVAPPLPARNGRVVNVGNEAQLRDAVTNAKDGDIIALADGTYRVVPWIWLKNKKFVTICGASCDPSKVILRGKGWDQGGD